MSSSLRGIKITSLPNSEATLQSQVGVITADVQKIECDRVALMAETVTESLRDSRRTECAVVSRLCQDAVQLQKKTETLLRSLKFVDEARGLLDDLDVAIELLLTLYPKSEKPFDLDAASAGYTMQEQHDVSCLGLRWRGGKSRAADETRRRAGIRRQR